jgi:hypothetical protein
VNEKVNLSKRYISQLRMWLYFWEHYGYEKAKEFFLKSYLKDKGHAKGRTPDIEKVISGKLEYLKMVKGSGSPLYKKLFERFNYLLACNNPLHKVISVWEKEGIDKAMELYYSNFISQV